MFELILFYSMNIIILYYKMGSREEYIVNLDEE